MEGFCQGEGGHRRRKVVVLWLVRGEEIGPPESVMWVAEASR